MKGKQQRARSCVICGSTKDLREHHLGGHNHAPFFTLTLCDPHHQQVHILVAQAGIDLRYTSDKPERARQARMAALVFLWFLDDQLKSEPKTPRRRRLHK